MSDSVAEIRRYYQLKQKLHVDGTENRSLTSYTRIQFSLTKPLLSTYLTCHSSAILTNKWTCLPYMLFTCSFFVPHAYYESNYTCLQVRLSKWLPKLFHTEGKRLTCAGIYRPSYRHMAGTMYIGESVANTTTRCVIRWKKYDGRLSNAWHLISVID